MADWKEEGTRQGNTHTIAHGQEVRPLSRGEWQPAELLCVRLTVVASASGWVFLYECTCVYVCRSGRPDQEAAMASKDTRLTPSPDFPKPFFRLQHVLFY